jgi:hypothetical protein
MNKADARLCCIGQKMNIDTLDEIIRELQNRAVGEPVWIQDKNVYEYPDKSIEVVVILKLVRAIHGIHSMSLLCHSGQFVDMCAIWRCVSDCISEVYFLLEKYPEKSSNVEKFINEFFSKTIDNFLSAEEESVQNKKVISAYARVLSGKEQDEVTRQSISRIHKTNSGYVHASYAHIMEMYGGPNRSFNLSGIPSQTQKQIRMEVVDAAKASVVQSMAFTALILGMNDLYDEIKKYY